MVSLSVNKDIIVTMDDGVVCRILEVNIPPPGNDQERADILNGKLDGMGCPPNVRVIVQGESIGVRVMWGDQPEGG